MIFSMKVLFQYEKEKDIWCLLNKGKSSNNSSLPTMEYDQLVSEYGESPTLENTSLFIEKYISDRGINVEESAEKFQQDWNGIVEEYSRRAESVFGILLPHDITAFLTINSRCPYSIEDNYFYVSMSRPSVRRTIMHELWHFYTWYSLGAEQEEKLGKERYNVLKESLTVLLNIECADLMPEGVYDGGYPQHQELREKIVQFWAKYRNMDKLWEYLIQTA
jgi:hypothetical protein